MNKFISYLFVSLFCLTIVNDSLIVPAKVKLERSIMYEFNIICPMVKEAQGYRLFICKDRSGIFIHPNGVIEVFKDVGEFLSE